MGTLALEEFGDGRDSLYQLGFWVLGLRTWYVLGHKVRIMTPPKTPPKVLHWTV